MAALLARNHCIECTVVLSLSLKLSGFGRDDARTRGGSGSFHHSPVGVELHPRTGQTSSSLSKPDERFMAGGRDVHSGQRSLEISLPHGGFKGQHVGLYAEHETGWQGSGAVFPYIRSVGI